MDYPRWVFKSPGEIKSAGDTYNQKIVANEKEYNAAIKSGFYNNVFDALNENSGEMTRNEVMEYLDLEGIKYNPRDKKEVLLKLIR